MGNVSILLTPCSCSLIPSLPQVAELHNEVQGCVPLFYFTPSVVKICVLSCPYFCKLMTYMICMPIIACIRDPLVFIFCFWMKTKWTQILKQYHTTKDLLYMCTAKHLRRKQPRKKNSFKKKYMVNKTGRKNTPYAHLEQLAFILHGTQETLRPSAEFEMIMPALAHEQW